MFVDMPRKQNKTQDSYHSTGGGGGTHIVRQMGMCHSNGSLFLQEIFKGALDKCNIIPNFFPKKVGIFVPLQVLVYNYTCMGNDCIPSFTF